MGAANKASASTSSALNSAATASNNLAKAQTNTAQRISASSTQIEEFGRQSALAVKRFAAFSAVTTIIFSVTNALKSGLATFVQFDKELVKLQQVTGKNGKELGTLSSEITTLSTTLGVASTELIGVAGTLAQAGLSAKDTERALRALALTDLAPSFDSMNETVEGSIALMKQFQIGAGDLESALGSINAVSAAFAVEASDIITAIQRTGGVFASASKGVSEGRML